MASLQESVICSLKFGKGCCSIASNTILGCTAGGLYNTSCSVNNSAIGYGAGRAQNACRKVSLGYKAGFLATDGSDNVFVGSLAGAANYTGCKSILVGQNSGYYKQVRSVGIGATASRIGDNYDAVALGFESFCQNGTKCKQTGIGFRAGRIHQGCGVVAVGYAAASNSSGNCLTAIGANTARFYNRPNVVGLGFYAYIYPGPGCNQFQIGRYNTPATSYIRTAWTNVSDLRDKTNVENLPNNLGLNFIRKLRPVSFKFDVRMEYMYKCGFEFGVKDGTLKSSKTNYGFLAQQIEETVKELNVKFDGVSYSSHSDVYRLKIMELLSPIVKAIQELNNELDVIEQQIG
jgi:hypothetical protein